MCALIFVDAEMQKVKIDLSSPSFVFSLFLSCLIEILWLQVESECKHSHAHNVRDHIFFAALESHRPVDLTKLKRCHDVRQTSNWAKKKETVRKVVVKRNDDEKKQKSFDADVIGLCFNLFCLSQKRVCYAMPTPMSMTVTELMHAVQTRKGCDMFVEQRCERREKTPHAIIFYTIFFCFFPLFSIILFTSTCGVIISCQPKSKCRSHSCKLI